MLAIIQFAAALMDGSEHFYAAAPSYDNGTGYLVKLEEAVTATGARCLDGSPAAYYIRKGTGGGSNKWYIHHQGGGWCESLDDCLARSQTALGSSQGYSSTRGMGSGYFSPLPSENPMMYSWNAVLLNYCDGGSFSGDNETVTNHKNTSLFFRGKRVREAMYASLLTEGLGLATDVVVSGCSAGGLAAFLHSDQWCDALSSDAPALAKCVGLPDSGFFLDYQSPAVPGRGQHAPREGDNQRTVEGEGDHQRTVESEGDYQRTVEGEGDNQRTVEGEGDHQRTVEGEGDHQRMPTTTRRLVTLPGNYHAGLRWCYQTFNASGGLNQDCIDAKRGTGGASDTPGYLCMFAEHAAVFTHTPIFALQSEYDSWQTGHVLHPGDSVQILGRNLTRRIQANLFGPHPMSGGFLDSCHHHCGAWNQIKIDGQLVSDAFAQWYASLGESKAKTVWRQGQPYPCAACCKPS